MILIPLDTLLFNNPEAIEYFLEYEPKTQALSSFKIVLKGIPHHIYFPEYFIEKCTSFVDVDTDITSQLNSLASFPEAYPLAFQFVCQFGKDLISACESSFCHTQSQVFSQFPTSVLREILTPQILAQFLDSLLSLDDNLFVPKASYTFTEFLFQEPNMRVIESFLVKLFEFLPAINYSEKYTSDAIIFFSHFIEKCVALPGDIFRNVPPSSVFVLYLKNHNVPELRLKASLYMALKYITRLSEVGSSSNEIFNNLTCFVVSEVLSGSQEFLDSIEGCGISAILNTLYSLVQEDRNALLSFLLLLLNESVTFFPSKQDSIFSNYFQGFVRADSLQYLSLLFRAADHMPPGTEEQAAHMFPCDLYLLSSILCFAIEGLAFVGTDVPNSISELFFADLILHCTRIVFCYHQSSSFGCTFHMDIGRISSSIFRLSSISSSSTSLAESFINTIQNNKIKWNKLWYFLIILRYHGSEIFSSLICSSIDQNLQSEKFNKYLLLLALGPRDKDTTSIVSRSDGRSPDLVSLSFWLFSIRQGSFIFPSNMSRSDASLLLAYFQKEKQNDDILSSIELIPIFQKTICMLKRDPVTLLITDGIDWLKSEVLAFYRGIIQNIMMSRESFHLLPIFMDFLTCYFLSDVDFIGAACNVFSFALSLIPDQENLQFTYSLSLFFSNLVKILNQHSPVEAKSIGGIYFSSPVWKSLLQFCFGKDFRTRGKKECLILLFNMLACSINNLQDLLISSVELFYPQPRRMDILEYGNEAYLEILNVCLLEMLFLASLPPAALDHLVPDDSFWFENILHAFYLLFGQCNLDEFSTSINCYSPDCYDLSSIYLIDGNSSENTVHNDHALRSLYIHSLYSLLASHPLKVRTWWTQSTAHSSVPETLFDKKSWTNLLATFDRFVCTRFSQKLIKREIELLRAPASKKRLSPLELNLLHSSISSSILVRLPLGEENAFLEMTLIFPQSYPLNSIVVQQTGKRVGVSEAVWRKWLLSTQILISGSTSMLSLATANTPPLIVSCSSTILEALVLWKKNAEARFSGIEECIICYSIFQPIDFSLPSKGCPSCKHKFHSSCLVLYIF